MYFIETSAKECDNVDKLFHEIARDLIQVQVTLFLSTLFRPRPLVFASFLYTFMLKLLSFLHYRRLYV